MANKFVTFLQKLGQDFKLGAEKALQIEAAAAPLEQAVAAGVDVVDPKVGATIQNIVQPLVGVEQVATAVGASSGTGAQKLAVALPQVEQVITSDPLFKGKVPADLTKYNGAITGIASAFVDLLNSFSAGPSGGDPPPPPAAS